MSIIPELSKEDKEELSLEDDSILVFLMWGNIVLAQGATSG